jgi:hypothetical protein
MPYISITFVTKDFKMFLPKMYLVCKTMENIQSFFVLSSRRRHVKSYTWPEPWRFLTFLNKFTHAIATKQWKRSLGDKSDIEMRCGTIVEKTSKHFHIS